MGMSAGGGSGTGAQPNINVTPLIDILLVLLIIFMVITPLKPARFKTLVPEKSEELSSAAKQSPRTLSVAITKDLKVTLTRGQTQIAEASVNDTGPIAQRLAQEFKERREANDWRPGFENRPELSPDERIEKTVFLKAPESFNYGEVVKVIDAVKGAGANPVGLQTELLEP
ncbi:MAG TPA: biopolymer transporter ExbD [Pyrinomonadaceae bacterium]|nr:biopolymer transporter ExbD [Pyrinomonadaceae bacterium]